MQPIPLTMQLEVKYNSLDLVRYLKQQCFVHNYVLINVTLFIITYLADTLFFDRNSKCV